MQFLKREGLQYQDIKSALQYRDVGQCLGMWLGARISTVGNKANHSSRIGLRVLREISK